MKAAVFLTADYVLCESFEEFVIQVERLGLSWTPMFINQRIKIGRKITPTNQTTTVSLVWILS